MNIKIFYSWQSDSKNNKNRGLIGECIKIATKSILKYSPRITSLTIETDSRNESGTPDLVKNIFEKIDSCDIFISDISIINPNTIDRLTPNPNVLLELGYAAKTLGWSKIICVYNLEYAKIEDLPFDIRFRKPVTYNTSEQNNLEKKRLAKSLEFSIQEIINSKLIDKREYLTTKRTIDVSMQSVILDLCRLLYENDKDNSEKFNYLKLLKSTSEDFEDILQYKKILGFHLYKDVDRNINNRVEFFKDELETYFLSKNEKRLLAKMVYLLREYKNFLHNFDNFLVVRQCDEYIILSGQEVNNSNPVNSLLLLKPLDKNISVVIRGGVFHKSEYEYLKSLLQISPNSIKGFSYFIFEIAEIVNEWIRVTGNYFIANIKEID